jgi:D-alanyl-D-alanine dipeptidase
MIKGGLHLNASAPRTPFTRSLVLGALLGLGMGCSTDAPPPPSLPGPPAGPPVAWVPAIGEYSAGGDTVSILESDGSLLLHPWDGDFRVLSQLPEDAFLLEGGDTLRLLRELRDGASVEGIAFGGFTYQPLKLGGEEGETFQITPLRPPAELREEALSATPPMEEGDFLDSDLVDVASLDPAIRLDIRYAGTNNFMGEVFYSSPRALLQRPAAEGVARANAWLLERGYGLLLHDGYRPWYVTKMFWDATPESLKIFVADPASGSRHNRGCAIDLTLYDLSTGEPVIMPGGYDEMSPRSFADYPGGTTRQRWLRDLLREALEAQGFTVYPAEWWHFDHQDWRRYRIQNLRFEEIPTG